MTEPAPERGEEFAGVPDAFERLWTPHRWAYVDGADKPADSSEGACPFCAAPGRTDEDGLIVHRGRTAYVILNLYPYNPGHLMVVPYRHVPWYTDLTDEERDEIGALTDRLAHGGVEHADDGAVLRFSDPWNNRIAVTVG